MALINPTTLKPRLMKSALNTLYYSGLYRLLEKEWRGVGAIFTLHHVRDDGGAPGFAPNRILDVTTDFLDATLTQVRQAGYDIVSLDEVHRRLREQDFSRRFVAFTLDDGYLDNYRLAWPVFKRHGAPFTVYVATAFPDGEALLWWEILERIIAAQPRLTVELDGRTSHFDTATTAGKYAAWDTIYRALRRMPETAQRTTVARLAEQYAVDTRAHCRAQSMSWEILRELATDELVTIGAHTVNHYALAKLPEAAVIEEVTRSREIIEQRIGQRPEHFSYPYGDERSAAGREFRLVESLGFKTATTTRKAMLYPEHADHLTALPRISLNGEYQSPHYTRLFLSGAPFALSNRFQRLVVN